MDQKHTFTHSHLSHVLNHVHYIFVCHFKENATTYKSSIFCELLIGRVHGICRQPIGCTRACFHRHMPLAHNSSHVPDVQLFQRRRQIGTCFIVQLGIRNGHVGHCIGGRTVGSPCLAIYAAGRIASGENRVAGRGTHGGCRIGTVKHCSLGT